MRGLLLVAALGAAGVGLLAGQAETKVRVDLEGGALVAPSDVEAEEDNVTLTSGFDSGGSYAVGAGYALSDSIELTAQFQQSLSGIDIAIGKDTLHIFSVTAGGRVYLLPPGRLRPWLVAQVGWYRAEAEAGILFGPDIQERDDGFGLNAGGGFDVRVSRHVSLGADVRYQNTFNVLGGLDFVTTMFNVGVHFGD